MIAALRRRPRSLASANPEHDDGRELARLVGECAASAIGRSALALRLSRLPVGRALPHHLRLARAALDPLLVADRARSFELANNDIVVVWRGDAAAAVRACRQTIDHLFGDEPNARPAPASASASPGPSGPDTPLPSPPSPGFEMLEPAPLASAWGGEDMVVLFDLPSQARDMLALVEESLAPGRSGPASAEKAAPALDLERLGSLEASLQQADLARFARRRPVCCSGAGGAMTPAWEKRFLCIDELGAALLPERSARSDPWLFRRLTRTLDRRMLVLLSHPEELREAGPFSLNLNVASILSAEFLRFDAALPARLRGSIVLELQPADIMADPAAFQFAREFARVRGYRLLLRGLTPVLLRVFAREALGVDWLELRWHSDLPLRDDPLGQAEPERLVLGRVDGPAAVAWGRARRIGHFRGPAMPPVIPAL